MRVPAPGRLDGDRKHAVVQGVTVVNNPFMWSSDDKLFDRKVEGGTYPDMKRLRQIKAEIRKRLDTAS